MIHGLSKYSTTGASAGIDYFLSETYVDESTREVREREPRPRLIEGDPAAMKVLCESLDFKHKYTSGVLSFSPTETDLIRSTPGMKEQILEDFKEFAFAGVKDDCRSILMVEHNHTGRLEVHYMIPRVSLESGKYFNPFPPNYDGKRGPGNDHTYKKHNDSFIDYMCEKHGLQNPRDPQFARSSKIKPFDPAGNIKKQVVEAIEQLIESGSVSSREDMFRFLEKSGATITRKGEDYFSFKFDDNKAVRLKGELYGRESFREIAARHQERTRSFEVSKSGFESRYLEALTFRAKETEERHKLPPGVEERVRANDLRSSQELVETKALLSDVRRNIDNHYSGARDSARHFASEVMRPSTFAAVSSSPTALAKPEVATGNPVLDKLLREYLDELIKVDQETMRRLKRFWAAMGENIRGSVERLQESLRDVFKLNTSLSTGLNFYRPGEPLFPNVSTYKQELAERINQVNLELRIARVAERQDERLQKRVRDPLAAFQPSAEGLPSGGTRSFAEAAAALKEEGRQAGQVIENMRREREDDGLDTRR